jgi:prevent-host-death family protein
VRTIGAYEAKTRLAELLDEVEAGHSLTITRHGRPVAVLTPLRGATGDRRAAIDALREARRGARLGRLTVRQLIEEGRR